MLSEGPKRPTEPKLRFEEGIRGFEAAKQAALLALSEVMGQFPEVSVHFTVGMPCDPRTLFLVRSCLKAGFPRFMGILRILVPGNPLDLGIESGGISEGIASKFRPPLGPIWCDFGIRPQGISSTL